MVVLGVGVDGHGPTVPDTPMGYETGALSERFGLGGVPGLALVLPLGELAE